MDYAAERSNLSSSLNFIIPARQALFRGGAIDVMCGHLRLHVTINGPQGQSDSLDLDLDVTLRQTLRVRGIMVSYNGPASSAPNAPNLNLAAPTLANLQSTAALTLLMYPVQSRASFSSAGTIAWNRHLQDAATASGGCSPNWLALNTALQAQRANDGNRSNWIYYGLLPTGIPVGPVIGCETSDASGNPLASAGVDGAALTMARAIGHFCGLQHAPCGGVGASADPNYPAYEPYDASSTTPQASIGEYGLDISNGNIFAPNASKDLMSYCGPSWISLYHYAKLLNNDALAPEHVCRDEPWWGDYARYDPWWWLPWRYIPDPAPDPRRIRVADLEPLISIIGAVYSADRVAVESVMRVDATRQVQNARDGPRGRADRRERRGRSMGARAGVARFGARWLWLRRWRRRRRPALP